MLRSSEKLQGGLSRMTIQTQSDAEYAEFNATFPDPLSPATHQVSYRWEDGPRSASRRIVFEPLLRMPEPIPASQTTASAPITPPAPPFNEQRRQELVAMGKADFDTHYGVVGLGSVPKNVSRAELVARVLEAEAKAGK